MRTRLTWWLFVVVVSLSQVPLRAASPSPGTNGVDVMWVTARSLFPGWGLYPNGMAYGGVTPLSQPGGTAWGSGKLTWVADFQAGGEYAVWIRRYGGYGGVRVTVDEKPLTGKGSGGGGVRYTWFLLGQAPITAGRHHVDVQVYGTMFDAIALTTNKAWTPDRDGLPPALTNVAVSVPRTYRDDSALKAAAGRRGYVVGPANLYEEYLNDCVPAVTTLVDKVTLWGCGDQYLRSTFNVRAVRAVERMTVRLDRLEGPSGARIEAQDIDLRVVHLRERDRVLFENTLNFGLTPDLLVRDDRTGIPPKGRQGGYGGGSCKTRIPAHESRQLWLTVHVPAGYPPGWYRGTIRLKTSGFFRDMNLPVEMEVLPLQFQPVEGDYGIYYPAQSARTNYPNYVTPERMLAELKDQARHGLNSTTLYGGMGELKLARQAGMTGACCLMHWPDGNASNQVAEARALGFRDLYYYGVDEPRSEAQIMRCRTEAERRLKAGLHMMAAINSPGSFARLWDVVDRPVYNTYVFSVRNTMSSVRAKGFRPVSYWVTGLSYPLYFRAMVGLYNSACGYLGASPWSYADAVDHSVYGRNMHAVSYPDESGEPIPSMRWEALRDGIDDVRYLQALDRAIAAADARLKEPNAPAGLAQALEAAKATRTSDYESIGGRWFEYLRYLRDGAQLDTARRRMADAIVAVNASLAK
ncbi:MAG: DUF4091 domain-containing protein [Kiritimatiellae bacterium]|nr:DUF4091 domain-containing protein [Kiritimatiellia bacterium]